MKLTVAEFPSYHEVLPQHSVVSEGFLGMLKTKFSFSPKEKIS